MSNRSRNPINSPMSNLLNEKRVKLGDDFIIHKNIYILENGQTDSMNPICPSFSNIKDYLYGKARIALVANTFFYSIGEYYVITASIEVENRIVRKINTMEKSCQQFIRELEISVIDDWGYRPMFVGVVQIPKQRKQLQFRVLPSKVRLKIVHSSGDAFRVGRKGWPMGKISASGIEDRKLAIRFSNRMPGTNVKLVSNMVERRPQIMGEIPDHKSPTQGEFFIPLNRIHTILPEVLLGDGIWVSLNKSPDAFLEGIQVGFSSSSFQSNAIQRVHMLQYPQGESNAREEAKDSKGVRDTRTPKKRVPKESKEGQRTHQAINSRQPSEVEPQTSPDRHSGDYISKHTHSGRLEDV